MKKRSRKLASVSGGKTQRGGKIRHRWLIILNWLYLGLLGLVMLNNLIGPEHWWGGSLNLYLPQWIWGLPVLLLLPLTLGLLWRRCWMPILGLVWVAWPIMGFCWPLPFRGEPEGTRLRVLTYNVKWGWRDPSAIHQEIEAARPDVICLQDAGDTRHTLLKEQLVGYQVEDSGQYLIASRFPILGLERGDVSFPGSNHHYIRCKLQVGKQVVTVATIHLITPRHGLNAMRHPRSQGISGLKENVSSRLWQADKLADDIRQIEGPLILAGDFNAPPPSIVCRTLEQHEMTDAFEAAGKGYGYTYGQFIRLKHPYLRIDHVFVSEHFHVAQSWVGNQEGSDHCPVLTDLILRQP